MEGLSIETLQKLQETAVEASGAKNKLEIINPIEEPRGVYLIGKPDGTFEEKLARPPHRDHTFDSIDQVGPFVDYINEDVSHPVVWYSPDGVVVVCNDKSRHDRACLTLNKTPQLNELLAIEKDKKTFTQKEFVRLLRITFADCRTNDSLLNYVREVRFSSSSNSGGSIHHGTESLGSDIEEEAVNADDCPESIEFSIRVFDDPFLVEVWQIKCAVEILVAEKAFRLVPFPLQVKNAIDMELTAVAKYLAESCKDVPVFRGCP